MTTTDATITKRPSSRRSFLRGAAGVAAVASTGLGPKLAFASPSNPATGDSLVVIFLRGGADGLSMTPPTGPAFDSYQTIRPTIAINPSQSLALDSSNTNAVFPQGMSGIVGLHPTLAPLYDSVWAAGQMAVIPAVGLPDSESRSRSHFEAQNFWDRGSASRGVRTGWLNRVMTAQGAAGPVPALSKSYQNPEMLVGPARAINVPDLRSFGVSGFRGDAQPMTALRAMYDGGAGLVNRTGSETLDVTALLGSVDANAGPSYPSGTFSRNLKQVANLLRANVGLQGALIEFGGWDHHGELGVPGDTGGRFWRKASEMAVGLRAFVDDLGPGGLEETTIVVISEFGRTIDENSSGGTDHGRGGTMFVIGGGVQGGVFGNDYPSLIEDSNTNRRALPVLTDFRQPLSEVLASRVGVTGVYPTFTQGADLGVSR